MYSEFEKRLLSQMAVTKVKFVSYVHFGFLRY
jgi:hypothetical protein